jgi:formate hydrogenlyase transcriptional activator
MPQKTEIEKLKIVVARLEREISGLQRSNVVLSEENRTLDKILNQLPGTFHIWDDTPELIRRNKKHDEITEYSEEDYRNMSPMDFFDEKERAKVEAALEQVFIDGETTLEATLVTKSGKKIPHVYSALRTTIAEKPVLIGFGIDISAQKQAEQQLHQALSTIKLLTDQLEAECVYLGEEIKLTHDHENIIGDSEVMQYVFYSIEQIAPTDTTVLIQGESGTGKELVARAIHHGSKRHHFPLIKVDCTALPENLIESELFGHEKGAFTDAAEKRIGRFELADNATIFLDEIGELPLELQKKLLRVLQDGEFERLGSSRVRHSNARIIAATNRNLEEEVNKGRFRKDLWYRINVFPLSVPPLRERKIDIPLLVNWILDKLQRRLGKQIKETPYDVMNDLIAYSWPGNVRELENVIERAAIITSGKRLRLASPLKSPEAKTVVPENIPMKSLSKMERDYILQALEKSNWNISGKGGAAELLGLNPSTLRGRMRKHDIKRSLL